MDAARNINQNQPSTQANTSASVAATGQTANGEQVQNLNSPVSLTQQDSDSFEEASFSIVNRLYNEKRLGDRKGKKDKKADDKLVKDVEEALEILKEKTRKDAKEAVEEFLKTYPNLLEERERLLKLLNTSDEEFNNKYQSDDAIKKGLQHSYEEKFLEIIGLAILDEDSYSQEAEELASAKIAKTINEDKIFFDTIGNKRTFLKWLSETGLEIGGQDSSIYRICAGVKPKVIQTPDDERKGKAEENITRPVYLKNQELQAKLGDKVEPIKTSEHIEYYQSVAKSPSTCHDVVMPLIKKNISRLKKILKKITS